MTAYDQSRELYERALKVLAGGVSSEFRKLGYPHPLFYHSAHGSHIVDVDGNDYLDFTLSQGPLLLGHNHPHVVEAVERAARQGQLYAGQHVPELELAERLQRLIPCAELLRFSLSGSEANHAALRVARAATGRDTFVRFEGQYHGWFDNVAYGVSAPSIEALGAREQPIVIPWTEGLPARAADEFILLPWNDLELVTRVVDERHAEIAAIITEPVMCNNGCIRPLPGFLEGLRALCDRYGIALIFDEVITGFRLNIGGAQTYYGVTPDLAVFAKALASGYPLSVLAGRRRWMQPIADGRVIHAGTLNAGVSSVAAALATLDVLEHEQVHPRLFALGTRLMEGLQAIAREMELPLHVQGLGPMFHTGFTVLPDVRDFRDCLSYDKAAYTRFVARMHDRGVRLIGRGLWYISAAHTEDEIDRTLEIARDILRGFHPEQARHD